MSEIGERRLGTISRKEEIYCRCLECGQEYWSRVDKNYPTCRACGSKVGKTYTNHTGDTYIKLAQDDPHFPMTIWLSLMGGGWVRTSRLAMARHLGRCLDETDQVWHLDRNKDNDDASNLVIRKPKPERILEKLNVASYKRGHKEGYEEGYGAGYREGYDVCFEEYKEFRGDTLTVTTRHIAAPIQETNKHEMPKPLKKTTRDEAQANQEYWAERARERQRAKGNVFS